MTSTASARATWLKKTGGNCTKSKDRIANKPYFYRRHSRLYRPPGSAKARQLQAEKGLWTHCYRLSPVKQASKRVENRQQEISEISRSLKGLAKELNEPVLALAQLSRSVEQRDKKRADQV
jgi:replicative DNA helicase